MSYKIENIKNDRVKVTVRYWGPHPGFDIYARREQIDQYIYGCESEKYFDSHLFLAHLDSFRTCGYVKKCPLDNVRVVRVPAPEPEIKNEEDEVFNAEKFAQDEIMRKKKRMENMERRRSIAKICVAYE